MGKTKPSKGTIRFKCVKCGAQLRVAEKMAGRYIDCPKCKGRTGVPDNQAEADAEGGEYGVKHLVVEVPDECDKCGQPLEKGTVFCIGCGYDYRHGRFREAATDVQTENAFVAWVRELNFGRITSVAVVVLLLGAGGFFLFNFMQKRSSGGNVSAFFYDQLSQMNTQRNTEDAFGQPLEKIMIVSQELGDGDVFLRLDDAADAAKAKTAGVDVEKYKQEGYTMVCDVRAADKTMLMVSKAGMGYFYYYANDTAAMFILLEGDTSGTEEVTNYAARIEATGNGSYNVFSDGLGPVYGAGGDFRGYYWTSIFEAGQTLSPDAPSSDFTYRPGEVWKMLHKAQLRDFRK